MSTSEVRLKNPVSEHDRTAGPANAAVTVLEYGNFQCIHCGQFFPVIKQARNLLGDDLRFVFRHFPNIRTHPHALRAAVAADAAGRQQKFWEMHDQLFTHQNALEDRDILRYARRIKLDLERYERDLSDERLRAQIETEYDRSVFDEHVTGTPTIYINEIRYVGATDLETLLAAIRAADLEQQIKWPTRTMGIRSLLDHLRR